MNGLRLQAILLLLALVFSGCVSRIKRGTPLPGTPEALPESRETLTFNLPFRIQNYQGKAEGGDIPEWVNRYFSGGGQGVERMAEYRDKYVFVGENRGTNFSALSQWQAAFSPAQDFAQLAASRIEKRLVSGAAGAFPDNVYGPFFEAMVKKAYDMKYQGVRKNEVFWVHLLFPEARPAALAEGEEPEEEEEDEGGTGESSLYVFLLLLTTDQPWFESQIGNLYNSAKTGLALTRSEEAAANRVWENFFNGF
jgi:hypothetical protein